jgi:hypothetical protein
MCCGFIELNDDMKIKGEEIIHQLNEAPDVVPIKRKVFGKNTKKKLLKCILLTGENFISENLRKIK